MSDGIFLGGGGTGYADAQQLLLEYANRHGLIAGATGTGKTVTLQILAEGFSSIGVPVFLSDVKGDLSGLAKSGTPEFKLHEPFTKRSETIREVGTGEAVTSMLMDKGVPGIVERTLIRPPSSQLGPITKAERAAVMAASPMSGKYDERLDRNSAAEMLAKRAGNAAAEAEAAEAEEDKLEEEAREHRKGRRYTGKDVERSTSRRSSTSDTSWGGAIASVVAKELKGTTGCRIVRRILGGLFKGR